MINPIAFSVFGFDIYWYGITYVFSFLFGYYFIMHFSKQFGFKKDIMEDLFLYFMIFSVLGGRVFEIIFYNLSYYIANPLMIFAVWHGGMSIHGGILFGIGTLYYLSKKYKLDFLRVLDIFAIPIALGLSFGRLANFINQELVGKITTSNLGVIFSRYDDNLRWPTTIFESVKNMMIFQTLLYMEFFMNLKKGIIAAWFLILYNFLRFFIDFLREPDVLIEIISMGQLLSLVYGFFGIWLLYYISKK